MNKYAAEGLVTRALAGDRILVVTVPQARMDDLGEIVEALEVIAEEEPARVRRSAGVAQVDFPTFGGRIQILSPSSNAERGQTFDTVFIDWPLLGPGEDELIKRYAPCINASPRGQIIRA